MLNVNVPQAAWSRFFDRLARTPVRTPSQSHARIRSVRSQDWEGEQEEAWLPFLGITYEEQGDEIVVALEGLGHRIEHPKAVWAEENPAGVVERIEILGAQECRDEIEFRPYGSADA
jgi:hypothetical protein